MLSFRQIEEFHLCNDSARCQSNASRDFMINHLPQSCVESKRDALVKLFDEWTPSDSENESLGEGREKETETRVN